MIGVTKQNNIAIIPARGGSKKIPRKNVLDLGGKPLIAWPIELAKSIVAFDRVIVSTDDYEIAEIAKSYGAEVPFIRPKNLSADEVPTLPVLQHVLEFLKTKEGYIVDNVFLLYPTSPFLRRERILEGIKLLETNQFSSIIGVRKVRGVLWKINKQKDAIEQFYPPQRVNRQYFDHLYEEAGNIFFSKAKVLIEENNIVSMSKCYFIEIEESEIIDIDTPQDLELAREKIKELQDEK